LACPSLHHTTFEKEVLWLALEWTCKNLPDGGPMKV
jgi:hypothetical protein